MNENKANHARNVFIWGCFAPLLALTILFFGIAFWLRGCDDGINKPGFIKDAEKDISRSIEEILKKEPEYDIDQTVMALYSIEKAMAEADGFEALTDFILQEDNNYVAKDVARLKYDFFQVYKKLLDSKDDLKQMNSVYSATTGAILSAAGLIGFDIKGGIKFDKEHAQKVWHEHLSKTKMKRDVKKRLRRHQGEMLELLFRYMQVRAKYIREWNELCTARDRAYLALAERDWDELIKSASAAVEMAPLEKEAHILLAYGLIERGGESDLNIVQNSINEFLRKHQGQSAPAYLLRGVLAMKQGNYEQANIDFDQAAAYYPRHQQELNNKLNLYRKRQFLNHSKEGRMIINQYRGIMTGSGYFSPDFKKAIIHLEKQESTAARKKIFDHFFRRRLQGQWDRVLLDFQFCNQYLQTDLQEIFAGDKLALEIKSALFSNSVIVTVHNRSEQAIHNMTLLLCVRFTDMFLGDYLSFPVGDSVALIPPGDSVTVGRHNITELTEDRLGQKKKWQDIIEYGAVLISDELITWIEPVSREPIQEAKEEEE